VLTAHAQQGEQIRRVGVLMTLAAGDPEGHRRLSAFQQKLQELGWTVWRNVQMDYRWAGAEPNNIRKYAEELVALN
jgi:putative ABC transport system substrate-binding protein